MHSPVAISGNILIHTLSTNLSVQCTHSPVGISGNILIDILYTNLSVQPMHSLTCWYLGQHPHTHSVHQSPAECSHTLACHWNNKQSQPISMCSGKGYYRKFHTTRCIPWTLPESEKIHRWDAPEHKAQPWWCVTANNQNTTDTQPTIKTWQTQANNQNMMDTSQQSKHDGHKPTIKIWQTHVSHTKENALIWESGNIQWNCQ